MLLLTAAGCQCAPPIDRPDGGDDDAGVDGGGGGGPGSCRVADCARPADAGVFWCPFRGGDAGFVAPSCIDNACVLECGGGRTCDVTDAGHCLRCGSDVRCSPATCTAARRCRFTVEGSSCTGLVDDNTSWTIDVPTNCRGVISNDGGVLGTYVDLDVGEAVVNIPRLGGTCIAQDLFTGVPRTQFFCPFCSFIAEGCD